VPYVYANVKVKYGQLPAFYEQMVTIKRVMEENGWKLVGAWSTVIGDIHEVHDLWQVEDANTVPTGFAGAFEDPEFAAASTALAAIADREVLSLVTKTPYWRSFPDTGGPGAAECQDMRARDAGCGVSRPATGRRRSRSRRR